MVERGFVPVLLMSHESSESAWVHIAACTHLRVYGLTPGDLVEVVFHYNGEAEPGDPIRRMLSEDGRYRLPERLYKLKVRHICESGTPINVDLINGS